MTERTELAGWTGLVLRRGAWPPERAAEPPVVARRPHDARCDCLDCLGQLGRLSPGGVR